MRPAQSFPVLALTVAALLTGKPVAAQTLAEHSAAAVGGSAAGVAGKPISDSLDKIMGTGVSGSLHESSQKGSTTVARPVPKAEPDKTEARSREERATSSSDMPLESGTSESSEPPKRTHHRKAVRTAEVQAHKVEQAPVRPEPRRSMMLPVQPMPSPVATMAELRRIKPGLSRKEVLARLGPPADRIQMADEDGRLFEVMHYTTRSADLGTVRMHDGVVTEIQIAN